MSHPKGLTFINPAIINCFIKTKPNQSLIKGQVLLLRTGHLLQNELRQDQPIVAVLKLFQILNPSYLLALSLVAQPNDQDYGI